MSESIENNGNNIAPQENTTVEHSPDENSDHGLDPQKEYASTLGKAEKLEEKLAEAVDSTEETSEKIDHLRKSMGLAPESDETTSSADHMQALEKQRADLEGEIARQEHQMLGVPEGEGSEAQLLKQHIDALDEKSIEGLEKKAREELVNAFIDSSIKDITDHFRTFLDESQNAEAAEILIQQKITFQVQKRAKDFVENGSDPDFGFEAEIAGMEFDDPSGGKVMYVTEFNLTFDGDSVFLGSDTYEPKEKLINQETQEQMNQAEEKGDLEEVGKETQ